MKNMQAHLEKMQIQIAECEMIRDLANDPKKRKLFSKLVEHFRVLAAEIEKTMVDQIPLTFLGRKTYEPFPSEEEP
jgi:hypothetical protein